MLSKMHNLYIVGKIILSCSSHDLETFWGIKHNMHTHLMKLRVTCVKSSLSDTTARH